MIDLRRGFPAGTQRLLGQDAGAQRRPRTTIPALRTRYPSLILLPVDLPLMGRTIPAADDGGTARLSTRFRQHQESRKNRIAAQWFGRRLETLPDHAYYRGFCAICQALAGRRRPRARCRILLSTQPLLDDVRHDIPHRHPHQTCDGPQASPRRREKRDRDTANDLDRRVRQGSVDEDKQFPEHGLRQ